MDRIEHYIMSCRHTGEEIQLAMQVYFFLVAFSAALVVLPPLPSDFSTDLMTPWEISQELGAMEMQD